MRLHFAFHLISKSLNWTIQRSKSIGEFFILCDELRKNLRRLLIDQLLTLMGNIIKVIMIWNSTPSMHRRTGAWDKKCTYRLTSSVLNRTSKSGLWKRRSGLEKALLVILGVCGTAIVVSGSYYAINLHNNSIDGL